MEIKHIDEINHGLDEQLLNRLNTLKKCLSDMGNLIVAYSGGVDSTLVLKVAVDILRDRVIAVIGKSKIYLHSELENAISTAKLLGSRYLVIETCELLDERFVSNPHDRCYYCKNELFSKLIEIAKHKSIEYIADGSNYDDIKDYRPGMKAASEMGIRSPLIESNLSKDDIIKLSRIIGLPTWDKPPQPCLSSRFPYGTRITKERLYKVAQAEEFLSQLGIKYFRVRYHNELARIEAQRNDIPFLVDEENSRVIYEKFRELGFSYTAIDILGYRMGSMNEILYKKKSIYK